ncbi:hypothetical protein IKR55_01265, partial [bacterium]|nr:hypothetical protein [bacterium]
KSKEIKSELEEERRLMYVGITRAQEKLYLTSAKRRQTWGEYRYYNPSQFIDEIPANLMESHESNGYSSAGRSTFRSAVTKAKENYATSDSDGYVKPTTGFGANFVAPKNKGLASSTNKSSYGTKSNRTPQRTILVKSAANKKREQEWIEAFMKDNPIKRMAEEKRKLQEAQRQQEIEREQTLTNGKFIDEIFDVGQRVFHEKLGIGHIIEVKHIGESVMYTIDFGKMGKKAMDASYAHLKKF